MKKTLQQNLSAIAFGLVFALALGAIAQSTTPPGGNIALPLHIGPAQVKDGGLSVASLGVFGPASLEQDVYFKGMIRGGTGSSSTIKIGDAGLGLASNAAVSGSVVAQSTIRSATIANGSNSRLCADPVGTIITCSGVTVAPIEGLKRFFSRNNGQWAEFEVANNQGYVPVTGGNQHLGMARSLAIGLNNVEPGWVINTLGGVQAASFHRDYTRLLNVPQSGNYSIKFNMNGRIGFKNKYNSGKILGMVNFYVKVNNNLIPLAGGCTAYYPDNFGYDWRLNYPWYCDTSLNTTMNYGDHTIQNYQYFIKTDKKESYGELPYSLQFNQTMALQQGDTIDLVAYVYSYSDRTGIWDWVGASIWRGDDDDLVNHYFKIVADNTLIDINLLP